MVIFLKKTAKNYHFSKTLVKKAIFLKKRKRLKTVVSQKYQSKVIIFQKNRSKTALLQSYGSETEKNIQKTVKKFTKEVENDLFQKNTRQKLKTCQKRSFTFKKCQKGHFPKKTVKNARFQKLPPKMVIFINNLSKRSFS